MLVLLVEVMFMDIWTVPSHNRSEEFIIDRTARIARVKVDNWICGALKVDRPSDANRNTPHGQLHV